MKISNNKIESPARRLAEPVLVLLDRLQLLAWPREKKLPQVLDFVVEQDKIVRQQTSIRTYRRVKIYLNHKTSTRLYVQYDPACPWLAPAKITVIADGQKGLSRSELKSIVRVFGKVRLLLVELALDFSSDSVVDREFVRAHGLFGKSRPVGGNLYATLNYGTRKSASFVRCYEKPELGCYRVEIQVHSGWLRKKDIRHPEDTCRLAGEILDSRFSFVQLDLDRLHAYFSRKQGPAADKLVEQVRIRGHVLHRALKYLKNDLGLQNPHRFLKPLKSVNQEIKAALHDWQYQWGCGDGR